MLSVHAVQKSCNIIAGSGVLFPFATCLYLSSKRLHPMIMCGGCSSGGCAQNVLHACPDVLLHHAQLPVHHHFILCFNTTCTNFHTAV
jgi:hypothetical protein